MSRHHRHIQTRAFILVLSTVLTYTGVFVLVYGTDFSGRALRIVLPCLVISASVCFCMVESSCAVFDVVYRQESRGFFSRWSLSSWSGYSMRCHGIQQRATTTVAHCSLRTSRTGAAEWSTADIVMSFPPGGHRFFVLLPGEGWFILIVSWPRGSRQLPWTRTRKYKRIYLAHGYMASLTLGRRFTLDWGSNLGWCILLFVKDFFLGFVPSPTESARAWVGEFRWKRRAVGGAESVCAIKTKARRVPGGKEGTTPRLWLVRKLKSKTWDGEKRMIMMPGMHFWWSGQQWAQECDSHTDCCCHRMYSFKFSNPSPAVLLWPLMVFQGQV